MSSQDENGPDEKNWKKISFVVSGILVALLVAISLVLLILPSNDNEGSSNEVATQPRESQQTGTADGKSVCGLDATGGKTLTKAPKDVEWEPIRSLYVPTSEEHGPGVVDESTQVRSCFSRTPEGALLSAVSMLGASADPELLVDTIQARGAESPGKTIALGQAQERASQNDQTMPPMEVAGFRILSFSEDAASVEVVMSVDDGTQDLYQTTSADMEWQDGDWKFKFGDDGSGGAVSSQVSDLSNYVKWDQNG